MAGDRLRVGVIGAGVGALHLAAFARIPEVEVIALAGLDDDRVQRVAAEYRVPQTFREYETLLAQPNIDAVTIGLPNHLHLPVTREALQANKHVLLEKPIARNPEEGQAIVAAGQASDRTLMIAFSQRCRGDVQWLKRYVETGALGRIYYAKAHWMRRSGIPRIGSWFVSKELSGGGPLIDLGVHVLDIALFLMGEPRPLTVSASTYTEFGPRGLKGWFGRQQFSDEHLAYDVEDLASAFIRLEGSATLTLEASWATHSSAGDDFGVTLYGTEGGAELMIRNYTHENTVRIFTDIDDAPTEIAPRIPRVEGHYGVIKRFTDAILEGAPAIPSAEDGQRRTVVLDACYRSAAQGREVVIEQ
jgi:predicted dehydrogenase